LKALNDAIADDDFAIGPSYFMGRETAAPAVEDVWRHQIIPLLEEHYYGTDHDVEAEFGLSVIRSRIAAAADESTSEPESDAEDHA
jgi:5-methylcytosine-specific restriction protein B